MESRGGKRTGAGRKTAMDEQVVANHFQIFKQAQAKERVHKANIAAIEEKKLKGELIHIDDVRREANQVARSTRDALLSLPSRLSSILAHQPEDYVNRIMSEELRKALESLADEHGAL